MCLHSRCKRSAGLMTCSCQGSAQQRCPLVAPASAAKFTVGSTRRTACCARCASCAREAVQADEGSWVMQLLHQGAVLPGGCRIGLKAQQPGTQCRRSPGRPPRIAVHATNLLVQLLLEGHEQLVIFIIICCSTHQPRLAPVDHSKADMAVNVCACRVLRICSCRAAWQQPKTVVPRRV